VIIQHYQILLVLDQIYVSVFLFNILFYFLFFCFLNM
jgi:hypothetical protein